MSPKIVNGSFAAIIDADEFLAKAYAGIRIAVSDEIRFSLLRNFNKNPPHLRITIHRQCEDVSVAF